MKLFITLLTLTCIGILFVYYSGSDSKNNINSRIIAKADPKSAAKRESGYRKNAIVSASVSKIPNTHITSPLDNRMQREINKDMRDKIVKMGPSKNTLLAELKLPPDKQKLAKQLLAEYEFVGENTFVNMRRNGNANPSRAQVQDQIEVNRQELMNNFKILLTDDQFTFLEYYLKTEPWRAEAGRLVDNMEKSIAEKLTSDSREAFIGLLTDGVEVLRIRTRGFSTVNQLERNQYMRQYFIENGGAILTPAQLDWLIKYYDKEISNYGD